MEAVNQSQVARISSEGRRRANRGNTWNFQSSEDILCDTLTMKMCHYAGPNPRMHNTKSEPLCNMLIKKNVSILVHINENTF